MHAGLGMNAVANVTDDDRPPPLDVTLTDRRRPGRKDYQNAHLIALMRGQQLGMCLAKAEVDEVPKALPVDDLAAARGIVIGAPIGAVIWAVAIFAIWYSA